MGMIMKDGIPYGGIYPIDDAPTQGSNNAVKSGGVFSSLSNKQNKINAKHVIFSDFQVNEGATEYFTIEDIATKAQIPRENIILNVWDGVQAKNSWSEIDCVTFYDVILHKWGVYNRGTGGKAHVSFTILYY